MSLQLKHVDATQALVGAALLTVALYFIPGGEWLLWPLTLLYTLVHELGHGLTAALLGGSFKSLSVWADGSGVAAYQGNFGRLASAAVAAGGLLGPPCAAMLLFAAGRRADTARYALGAFAIALVLVALLWVRNVFGLGFVVATTCLLGLLAWRTPAKVAQIACVFLAVQLSLSVFARGDYLFTASAQTAQGVFPSDTARIAEALLLPYWVWGGVLAVLSIAVVLVGLYSFAKALR